MSDIQQLDCRGLSCPQPALMAREAMSKKDKGTIEILVDSGTARENISRIAQSTGWKLNIDEQPGGVFKLVLKK